jgi:predicted transcriptional regulator
MSGSDGDQIWRIALSIIDLTADVVAAFVAKNRVPLAELPGLIVTVHRALIAADGPDVAEPETATVATRAQIKRSLQPDALISFLDGKPYKMLKRHIGQHGMTPTQYRERFGLPNDYPLTAPSYSASRSAWAKAAGLGQKSATTPKRKTAARTVQ